MFMTVRQGTRQKWVPKTPNSMRSFILVKKPIIFPFTETKSTENQNVFFSVFYLQNT